MSSRRQALFLVAILGLAACASGAPEGLGSRYCGLARAMEADNLFDEGALDPADPKESSARIRAFEGRARDAIAASPAEIEPDLKLLVEGTVAFARELEAAGFDFAALDPERVKRFADPKFDAAGRAVEAYNRRVCGIGTASPS